MTGQTQNFLDCISLVNHHVVWFDHKGKRQYGVDIEDTPEPGKPTRAQMHRVCWWDSPDLAAVAFIGNNKHLFENIR